MVAEVTEERQAQIQRILDSKAFRTSEVQRNLLQYLALKALAGEGDSVKEYTIGLDVFAKPDSFDPRQESSVRMHVARLRQKLADYYRLEGTEDSIFVDLPKGGFKLVFEDRLNAVVPAPAPVVETEEKRGFPWRIVAGLAAALVVGVGAFAIWKPKDAAPGGELTAKLSGDLAALWRPFFDSPRPILVCLSVGKDPAVNVGTANGAFFLGQFLTPNRKREVVVTRSDQISMPEIAMDNIVFVGPTEGTGHIESIPMEAQFVLDGKGVKNLNPKPGEPAYFADRSAAGEGTGEESYALISHVPGLYGNGQVLLLEGNRTSSVMAAVRSITDANLAGMMTEALSEHGRLPPYYQVVLRVRSMDEMPVEVTFVADRALPVPQSH